MLWMYVMRNYVKFCLYYDLEYLNEAEFMEEYKNEVGLGGLEWLVFFYPGYWQTQWMSRKDSLMMWWLMSSSDGRSSVLPLVESELWPEKKLMSTVIEFKIWYDNNTPPCD